MPVNISNFVNDIQPMAASIFQNTIQI